MRLYSVTLADIQWEPDAYQSAGLPTHVTYTVEASRVDEAIDDAVGRTAEQYGGRIEASTPKVRVLDGAPAEGTEVQEPMSRDERVQTYDNMKRWGGGFVSSLAEAFIRADARNEMRLRAAFPEIFEKYRLMHQTYEGRVSGSETVGF